MTCPMALTHKSCLRPVLADKMNDSILNFYWRKSATYKYFEYKAVYMQVARTNSDRHWELLRKTTCHNNYVKFISSFNYNCSKCFHYLQ